MYIYQFQILIYLLQNFIKICNKIIKNIKVFQKKADICIRKGIKAINMSINITHTMNSSHFENKENLRNAAKNLLNKQGASAETTHRILEQAIFTNSAYNSPQLNILSTSAQITLNNNLKETLKYLNQKSNKKEIKKYVLGELWEQVDKEEYQGELIDFEINFFTNNIFAA